MIIFLSKMKKKQLNVENTNQQQQQKKKHKIDRSFVAKIVETNERFSDWIEYEVLCSSIPLHFSLLVKILFKD